MNNLVEVKSLKKNYGQKEAVKDISKLPNFSKLTDNDILNTI